jgi:hypothetical protein
VADLVITAANVAEGASGTTVITNYKAGATVTQGQGVYLDPTTTTWKLTDANGGAPGNISDTSIQTGVALASVSSGQRLPVQTAGPYTVGATVATGTWYIFSATPGGICPVADQVTGWTSTLLGQAISTTQINITPIKNGVAVP